MTANQEEQQVKGPISQQDAPPSSTNANHPHIHPPDTLKAWIIVCSSMGIQFFVIGNLFTYSVMMPAFLEDFPNASYTQISAIGTTELAMFFLFGLVAGPLSDKLGPRVVIFIGSLIWFTGYISTSYAQTFGELMFTYAILTGIGTSFCYWSIISIIPQWFVKRRALGTGIALLGGQVGQLVYGFGFAPLLTAQQWRGTFRILAGVALAVFLICLLPLERRFKRKHHKVNIRASVYELFHDPSYVSLLFAAFFLQFGLFVPVDQIVPYSLSKGLSYAEASNIIGIMGATTLVGRVFFSVCSAKTGGLRMFQFIFWSLAILLFGWLGCTDFSSIAAFGSLLGWLLGGFFTVMVLVASELWGVERLGVVMGFMTLVMVPGAASAGVIAGALYDTYNSFTPVILYSASVITLAALFTLGMRKTKKGGKRPTLISAKSSKNNEQEQTHSSASISGTINGKKNSALEIN